jgi:hypothetical protein
MIVKTTYLRINRALTCTRSYSCGTRTGQRRSKISVAIYYALVYIASVILIETAVAVCGLNKALYRRAAAASEHRARGGGYVPGPDDGSSSDRSTFRRPAQAERLKGGGSRVPKKSRNEGRTHDVIDNKGQISGTHDVNENK